MSTKSKRAFAVSGVVAAALAFLPGAAQASPNIDPPTTPSGDAITSYVASITVVAPTGAVYETSKEISPSDLEQTVLSVPDSLELTADKCFPGRWSYESQLKGNAGAGPATYTAYEYHMDGGYDFSCKKVTEHDHMGYPGDAGFASRVNGWKFDHKTDAASPTDLAAATSASQGFYDQCVPLSIITSIYCTNHAYPRITVHETGSGSKPTFTYS